MRANERWMEGASARQKERKRTAQKKMRWAWYIFNSIVVWKESSSTSIDSVEKPQNPIDYVWLTMNFVCVHSAFVCLLCWNRTKSVSILEERATKRSRNKWQRRTTTTTAQWKVMLAVKIQYRCRRYTHVLGTLPHTRTQTRPSEEAKERERERENQMKIATVKWISPLIVVTLTKSQSINAAAKFN